MKSFARRSWWGGLLVAAVLAALVCGGRVAAVANEQEQAATGGHESQDAHEAGHGAHDLGEGNAGPALVDLFDLRFDLAIYTAVVFFLLLLILWKFAWGPISHGLEHREQGIAEKIEAARVAAERATEQLRSYEAKLATAGDEAREIIAQARRHAEAAQAEMLTEAKQSAQRERDRAIEDITAAKNAALREIAQKSVSTAVSLAGRIIRKEVKPGDHVQLIREALEQFPSAN